MSKPTGTEIVLGALFILTVVFLPAGIWIAV